MMLSIFSRAYLPSVSCLFFLIVFLLLSLHVLSPSLKLLFILSVVSFMEQNILILMESNLSISSSMGRAVGVISKNASCHPRSQSLLCFLVTVL